MTTTSETPIPNAIEEANPGLKDVGRYAFGWSDSDDAGATAVRGLNEDVVRNISKLKDEPEWMLDLRLKGLRLFRRKPMPTWGADLDAIDFENIKYFVRSSEKQATSWEELPEDIKNTYDKLGIPEAETEMFSSLLGTHVQRLATIANGDGVCTTHLPHQTTATTKPAAERLPS